MNGVNTGIGWQSSSGNWECKIEGKTIIEDIEETPWNPIETSHEFFAESLDYDTQALDDDQEILLKLADFTEIDDFYSDLDFYRLSELILNEAFIDLQNLLIRY